MAPPKNSEIKFFQTNYWKFNIFSFGLFIFVPEKPQVDPKNVVFEMGWTWVAGSTWDFSEAKDNCHKSWKLQCHVTFRYPKKYHFKIFGRAVLWWANQNFLFRDNNPEKSSVTFFLYFSQRSEVSSSLQKKLWPINYKVPIFFMYIYIIFIIFTINYKVSFFYLYLYHFYIKTIWVHDGKIIKINQISLFI